MSRKLKPSGDAHEVADLTVFFIFQESMVFVEHCVIKLAFHTSYNPRSMRFVFTN